jgi:hypothetical protein
MRKSISFFVFASLFFAIGISTAAAEVRIQTGLNFDWWSDSKDNDARQLQVPLTITGQLDDFSFKVLTAYTATNLDRSGIGKSSLDHLLDTKLVTSYAIIDKLPVDIMLGLDFNLPTGKTNLRQSDLALIMDPDLITINNFGEGFDVNPTVTLAKGWGNWVVGAGFGYLWRGSYDFSSEINITDYQPGDIYNINAEARYYISPELFARFFGSHAWYGRDTVRGTDFFQQGDFSRFGAGLYYDREKSWNAGLSFHGILRDKSNYQTGSPGNLVTESYDGQGDEWVVDLSGGYQFPDEKTVLRSSIQGRYFTKNDYSSASPFFIGKREKLSAGFGVTRAICSHFEAGLDIRGFVKHDDDTNFPLVRSARDFQGFSATMMLSGNF